MVKLNLYLVADIFRDTVQNYTMSMISPLWKVHVMLSTSIYNMNATLVRNKKNFLLPLL